MELSGEDFNTNVITIINEVKYTTITINEKRGNLKKIYKINQTFKNYKYKECEK